MRIKQVAGILIQLMLWLFCLALTFLPQAEYLLTQAKGQLSMSFAGNTISNSLNDPKLPSHQKEGLLLTMKVLQFAQEKGLKTSRAYTTFCKAEDEKTMWMLSAVSPYSLEPYEWSFPLFGSFSYKGFFSLSMALQEKNRLAKMGYDTELVKAAGWSTLGWFPDPVTASMLDRKPYDLAELLLHELVHKTVYLKDSVEWNENLAVICARSLCMEFLKTGGQAVQLESYQRSIASEDSLLAFAARGMKVLDELYKSPDFRPIQKKLMIHALANDFLRQPWSVVFPREKVAASIVSEGNAWFLSHYRYGGGSKELGTLLYKKHRGNVMAMINDLKRGR